MDSRNPGHTSEIRENPVVSLPAPAYICRTAAGFPLARHITDGRDDATHRMRLEAASRSILEGLQPRSRAGGFFRLFILIQIYRNISCRARRALSRPRAPRDTYFRSERWQIHGCDLTVTSRYVNRNSARYNIFPRIISLRP